MLNYPAVIRPHRLQSLLQLLLYGLFCLSGLLLLLGPAGAEAPAGETVTCFDRIWHGAHDHPWYLDAQGQEIVPEVVHDWLLVKFNESVAPPRPAEDFYQRYPEAFENLVASDSGSIAAVYQLRQGLPYGLFEALLQRWRNDPQVHSIQPAWRIDGQLYAPLDQIEVEWKTAADPQTRQRLLADAQARQVTTGKRANTEVVTIDPCYRLAWQTAALLTEELYVIRAAPLKTPLEPPVAVQLQLDSPGAMAGMPIPFRLEIRFAEGIKIEAATIANLNLNPSGVFHNLYDIRFNEPLSAVDLSHSPIQISGTLRLYASGDYQLPALPVYYTDQRSGEARPLSIRTENQPIRIASMVPEGSEGYRLQIARPSSLPTITDPALTRIRQRAAVLCTAGLLLLTLGLFAWLRPSSRRTDQAQIMAQQRLQKNLDDLTTRIKGDPLAMQPDDWAQLGRELQTVLGEYAGLPAATRGSSHSTFLPRIRNYLTADEMRQAQTVLKDIEYLLAADRLDLEARRAVLTQAGLLLASLATRTADQKTDRELH